MTRVRLSTTHIIIHGSRHTPEENPSYIDIEREDRRRGKLGCGSHFVITRDGDIHGGRPLDRIGCVLHPYNQTAIFVCLVGGRGAERGWQDNYTPEQRAALAALLRDGLSWEHYGGAAVRTLHDVLKQTHSPGFALRDWPEIPTEIG